jgi:hypothetical protein
LIKIFFFFASQIYPPPSPHLLVRSYTSVYDWLLKKTIKSYKKKSKAKHLICIRLKVFFNEFLCEKSCLTFDLDFWKTAPYFLLTTKLFWKYEHCRVEWYMTLNMFLNILKTIARWLETSFPKFNRHEYYTAVSYIIRLGNVRIFKIIWSSKENMVQFFRNQGQRLNKIVWLILLELLTITLYTFFHNCP